LQFSCPEFLIRVPGSLFCVPGFLIRVPEFLIRVRKAAILGFCKALLGFFTTILGFCTTLFFFPDMFALSVLRFDLGKIPSDDGHKRSHRGVACKSLTAPYPVCAVEPKNRIFSPIFRSTVTHSRMIPGEKGIGDRGSGLELSIYVTQITIFGNLE